jgi:glycosyltransferase involved in cell wall biosynthesis
MPKKLIIFIPHIKGGGVEKNFFIITNFLAEKLSNVSVITINKEYKNKLNKKIKIISPVNNRWKESSIYTKYFIALLLLVKTILTDKNFTILTFQANWYSIAISKIFGIKIISRSNTAPEGWSKSVVKNFLYKIILNLANSVIVNSLEFKNQIKKKFNVNSTCILNPLNKNEIIKLSKKKIKFSFFKKNFLNIISLGRFTDQKNHILILKSINYINNKIPIRLLLAGSGENYNKLSAYIKKKNLHKTIKMVNFLENPYPYINKSDLLILSSNFEGLPNILLEAQCLKKFIISTKCPTGPKEILLNGKAGLFFKMNDHKDLAKKIIFYFANRKKMKQKINLGYKNLYKYDKSNNLNKYYKLVLKYLS